MMRKRTNGWIAVGVVLAALILCLFLRLTSDRIASSRGEQTAAERFSTETLTNDSLSLFLPSSAGATGETVLSFRQSMEQTLLNDSILSGGGRLYVDAYSGFAPLGVSTDRGSVQAEAGYVGGDFFFLHPFELLNGSYLPSEPIDPMLILLDDRAAWTLFGALDIAGFTCTVNGERFTVAGVFRSEDDALYGNAPRVYLPYEAFGGENAPPVTCYEAVLPEPVKEYAMGLLQSAASSYKENGIFKQTGSRFELSSLLNTLKSLPQRGVRTQEIAFPYWENIACVNEDRCALLLFGRLIVYGLLLLSALILLIRYYRTMTRAVSSFFRFLGGKIADGYDRIRCRKYYKNQNINNKKENSDEE